MPTLRFLLRAVCAATEMRQGKDPVKPMGCPRAFPAPFVCPGSVKLWDMSTATHAATEGRRGVSLPQSQKPLKLQQLLGDTTEEVTVSHLLNLGTRNSPEFKLSAPGQGNKGLLQDFLKALKKAKLRYLHYLWLRTCQCSAMNGVAVGWSWGTATFP